MESTLKGKYIRCLLGAYNDYTKAMMILENEHYSYDGVIVREQVFFVYAPGCWRNDDDMEKSEALNALFDGWLASASYETFLYTAACMSHGTLPAC